MKLIDTIKKRAADLKLQTAALALACRDPGTPWYAKLLAAAVVAYALSPIDLIPDFIPVLGYLDDLLLVPLGIALAIRMIPKPVMERCRSEAAGRLAKGSAGGRAVAALIIAVWVCATALAGYLIFRAFFA